MGLGGSVFEWVQPPDLYTMSPDSGELQHKNKANEKGDLIPLRGLAGGTCFWTMTPRISASIARLWSVPAANGSNVNQVAPTSIVSGIRVQSFGG